MPSVREVRERRRGERGRGGYMTYRVEGSGLFDVEREDGGGGVLGNSREFFLFSFFFPPKFIWGVKATEDDM